MQRPFGRSTTMSTHLRPCTAVMAALPVSPDVPVSQAGDIYIYSLKSKIIYKRLRDLIPTVGGSQEAGFIQPITEKYEL